MLAWKYASRLQSCCALNYCARPVARILPGSLRQIFVRREKPRGNTVFRSRRKCFPHTRSSALILTRAHTHIRVHIRGFPMGLFLRSTCERDVKSRAMERTIRSDRYCSPGTFFCGFIFNRAGPDRAAAICRGDSIQSHVIGVISLPRLSVAQSTRAPNACGITCFAGNVRAGDRQPSQILHLPPIYISAAYLNRSLLINFLR